MGRWAELNGFTIQGNDLLEVSRGSCVLVTIIECNTKIVECIWAIGVGIWSKLELFTKQGDHLLELSHASFASIMINESIANGAQ
jgi:hypothetical protein